jgi:WhiB family transcriptional regulator, redox-sensing transcriptional regulator
LPKLTDEGNVMSAHAASEAVTSDDVTSRPPAAVISPDLIAPLAADRLADQALAARVARYARCADSGLDPDEWFPLNIDPARARQEAAAALAVCAGCLVRGPCLELSLRLGGIGKHGIWGGLVAADRARLRAGWAAGRDGAARG